MNEISSKIASAVEQQETETHEITDRVQQVASGAQEVSTNISVVSTTAHSAGSAASDMLTATDELNGQSEILRIAVEEFLDKVRAA